MQNKNSVIFPAIFACLAITVAATPLSDQKNKGRIVGGERISIAEVPYQVSLQLRGRHNCGGSIISSKWMITAGHCLNYDVRDLTARVGSNRHDQEGTVHTFDRLIKHEDYRIMSYGFPIHDIGLLRVREPFPLNDDHVSTIPLFDSDEKAPTGTLTFVTGWGVTMQLRDPYLRGVLIPLISTETCRLAYQRRGPLPIGQICAAFPEGGKDSCQGDSGGPMVVNGKLAGIVSWGIGCASPKYPGVYTEVAYYRDWISKHADI